MYFEFIARISKIEVRIFEVLLYLLLTQNLVNLEFIFSRQIINLKKKSVFIMIFSCNYKLQCSAFITHFGYNTELDMTIMFWLAIFFYHGIFQRNYMKMTIFMVIFL